MPQRALYDELMTSYLSKNSSECHTLRAYYSDSRDNHNRILKVQGIYRG